MSQLPTSANPPTSTPIQSVCSSFSPVSSGGGLGPGGGGFATHPTDGQIRPVSGTDGNIYVGGEIIASYDHLVSVGGVLFGPDMAPYLISMRNAAAAEGVTLKINSGHRTWEHQYALKHGTVCKSCGNDYRGRSEEYKKATATAGYSPHQCGLAVDIQSKGAEWNATNEWLTKNAYRYGFIRRVRNERWHWEYLGTWPHLGGPPEYALKWEHYMKTKSRSKSAFVNFKWGCPMFFFVPRIHGVRLSRSFRFGSSGGDHPDWNEDRPNTWLNWYGEHMPDKLDRLHPGWDQMGPAQPPELGTSEQPTDELGTSDPPADVDQDGTSEQPTDEPRTSESV